MKLLAAVVIAFLVWLVGLMAFADRVQRSTPAAEPSRAEGIVVLTGASDARIASAMELLRNGKGRRLLVSGVNREVRRPELREITPGSNRLFDCCVDLGFDATDTVSNAQEAATWARSKRFHHLILVTSDYHLPRALLELRGAAPLMEVQGYAVRTPSLDTRRWWRSPVGARRMTLEYCKYLTVLVREGVLGLFGEDARKAGADAQHEKA